MVPLGFTERPHTPAARPALWPCPPPISGHHPAPGHRRHPPAAPIAAPIAAAKMTQDNSRVGNFAHPFVPPRTAVRHIFPPPKANHRQKYKPLKTNTTTTTTSTKAEMSGKYAFRRCFQHPRARGHRPETKNPSSEILPRMEIIPPCLIFWPFFGPLFGHFLFVF